MPVLFFFEMKLKIDFVDCVGYFNWQTSVISHVPYLHVLLTVVKGRSADRINLHCVLLSPMIRELMI